MRLTRREWLAAGAGALGGVAAACGPKTTPRYQGYALVANRDGRTLGVIDLSRFQLLKEVPLAMAPETVLAAPDRARAFVFSSTAPFFHVADLESMQLKSRVNLKGSFIRARVSADQRLLWVAVRDPNLLLSFDTSTGERKSRVSLPAAVDDMDLFADQVGLAASTARTVVRCDSKTGQLTSSPVLKAVPGLLRWRPDGKVLLIANTEDRSMTAVDSRTMQPMVDLQLPLAPSQLCFNNDGGQLFVTGEGMDAVAIVSPYQTEVNETVLAGRMPGAMAVTSAGPAYLFISNTDAAEVTVINIDNRRVIAQIPVGQRPGPILLTPDNEYALILNEQSGDVAVIRLLNIRDADLNSRRSRTAPLFTMIPIGARPVSAAIAPRLL
jgi:YVTN family beta-propeller protein